MRTKYTSCLFIFLCLHVSNLVTAQQAWFQRDSARTVTVKGKQLVNPWAGGLNSSQFLKMDLNDDGTEDLVVFDRTNNRITTFVASTHPMDGAKKTFVYAPAYEAAFPKLENWVILADYNGDGLKDLFTSTSLGVKVFKQVKTGKVWAWEMEKEVIHTKGFSSVINLQVSGPDIPGIADIDGDGDLDIITFDFAGEFIELHQNLSIEKFGVPDSLGDAKAPVFARNGNCWGNFHKGSGEDFVFNVPCGVSDNTGGKVMHAGNSILLRDMNGDGKPDLLVGHVSNNHISFLKNSSSGLIANFTSFDNNFPTTNPVSFHIFPTAFMEDVDFDGVDDLLVAPGVASNDGNLVDFKSSNLFYRNAGTNSNPDFKLIQKNFLQDEMIDVGENAAPSFFDIDGDGDLDLILGTGGIPRTKGFIGGLWLLTNTGSAQEPAYEVTSEDYLGLSSAAISMYNIKPQWADFNGDGVVDLGFFGTATGTLKPVYYYVPNKGTKGGVVQLTMADAVALELPVESQIGDAPFFYDADRDGDLDLIVGKPQGNVHFYTNAGTGNQFNFQLETEEFAGLALNFEGRFVHAVPVDLDLDGQVDLLTVDHTGNVRVLYKADWGKWTERKDNLVSLNGKSGQVNLGKYLTAAVGDINGDGKPDLVVGNNGGGLALFTNILPVTITGAEPQIENKVIVFPNPAKGYIKVISERKAELRVLNLSSIPVVEPISIEAGQEKEIITTHWPAGLYIVEIATKTHRVARKIVVQ